MRTPILGTLIMALCLALVAGCGRSRGEARTPSPDRGTITVAPFTQPTDGSQLILGAIPEDQGRIAQDALPALDRKLREILMTKTKATCVFPQRLDLPEDNTRYHTSDQPGGLPLWLNYGRRMNARILLVPLVLNWHEREGSAAGVTRSAHVKLEFYMLDVPGGRVINRSVFEEKQVGLTENLLGIGTFIKRRASWVTASELADEGMKKAMQDFSL
ncbi:MAG: hypothetical protein LBR22_02995 [Desulfovibrio sp.]|jgi:hypothetical protein|nr:hypothetical protein [Desulfovibrio sp.]